MSEAEPSPDPKPAPRLGSYLLSKQLGSGGMSNVFQAIHEETGNVVAVKVLPRSLAKNVTLLQRFIREAKSAEALDHPNIVAIYDRGFDQGRHYLVLEYVEGRDLHDRVRLNGPLGPDEAIRFIRQVAEGLRYASSLGMIHRDVKPANLLMTPEGHAKIIDLGLALQTEDEDERVTRDGTTVGTVDYMSPEQARDSRQTSERSDMYSLGCTFYYLLTGSQPFPGGGLADKLARHYKAPIPEVRATRSEVSEALSLLIRRMMEKKPEQRFAGYDELIDALDALSHPSASRSRPPAILDAVIVDDDDEDDALGLAPTDSAVTPVRGKGVERPPSTRDYMMAEIVDDDGEDDLPSKSSPKLKTRPVRREPESTAEISLAELAALDSDGEISNRRQGRRIVASPPAPSTPRLPVPSLDDFHEDEHVEGVAAGSGRSRGAELSLKTWIAAGVMVGLAIAIVGFGVSMVISIAKPKPPEVATNPEPEPVIEATPTVVVPRPRTIIPGPVRPTAKPREPIAPPPPPVVTATPAAPAKEAEYPKAWEDRLHPPSSSRGAPPTDRPSVFVRRPLEAGEETQFSTLAAAFRRAGDVVEIADTGPFFEDDFQVAGKSRLIRARPGVRPIIQIADSTLTNIEDQEAKFVLGGPKIESLTLEGIDLVVDLRVLPVQQATLFLCQGAEVILRDCSITLVHVGERKVARFSVFRVEEGRRPNRVVLERSTIRGPIRTLVDVAAARAEVVLDRSLVIGDAAPLISLEPVDRPDRRLYFHRSVVANRGPILEFTARSTPMPFRSLGSTFARIEGGNAPGMFYVKAGFAGEPKSALDWSGEDNNFVGWPAWLVSGSEGTVRVTGLAGVKTAWSDSDGSSRESPGTWPSAIVRDDVDPEDIASLAPDRRGTLARIAFPHPSLREMTYGSLGRLLAPELSDTLIPPYVAPPPVVAPQPPPRPAVVKNPTGPTPPVPKAEMGRPNGPLELTFDVLQAPWSGDLGRFLAEKIVPGTTRATIRVRGGGSHGCSPIRFPDGLSIALLGESAEGLNLPMPTFVPRAGAVGFSMFELRGGDLALANLGFSTEGAARPRHWVRVEDGLLAIKHCRFRDPGGAAAGVGPMISFVAASGAPIPPRVGPFKAETNRPTARLMNTAIWTGGDAISAELGRGVVDLENCLIISGGPSIALLPRKAERDKFEADLVLERCTIANDRTGLYLGPWLGDSLGPDRPWLVSTRSCAFPRTQAGSSGVMLLADPDAMTRATLFWQSNQDAYDVSHLIASSGVQPQNAPPADIKKGWIDFWGSNHAKYVRGPDPRRPEVVFRYKDKDRPKPGRVTPSSLELDPKSHKDLGVNFKDLPLFTRN